MSHDASSSLVRTCALCEQPAVGLCPRCRQPLCDEHEPSTHKRCVECELEYDARRGSRALVRAAIDVPAVIVGVGWAALLVYLLGSVFPNFAGMMIALLSLGLGIGGGFALYADWRVRGHLRQRFLEEGSPPIPEATLLPGHDKV